MPPKKSNIKDQIVHQHFSRMAKASWIARQAKFGPNHMKDLSLKAAATFARRRGIVNVENPEKNCKICGFDHEQMNDENRKAYGKAHAKYMKKQQVQKAQAERKRQRMIAKGLINADDPIEEVEVKPIVIIENLDEL